MKKILLFVLLLLNVYVGFSQAEIRSDGAVHATGNFPVAVSKEIKGTPKTVKDTVERNAIPIAFRDTGMFCYVTSLKKTYQLQDGINNTNWVEYKSGGANYKQGTAIVIGSDTTINVDTTNTVLTKQNATNTYVPNDTLQDFSSVLDFTRNRKYNTYIQSGTINFTLASVAHRTGRNITLNIDATDDSVNFPYNWHVYGAMQSFHLNNLSINYINQDSIDVYVKVLNPNHSNLVTLDSGVTQTVTWSNFLLEKIIVNVDTPTWFSIGTSAGGSDIVKAEYLLPGETVIQGINKRFIIPTALYFTGTNQNTIISIYDNTQNN